MKISISGVCERDMDLFLIEELVADRDLLVWLFERCDLGGEPYFEELAFTQSETGWPSNPSPPPPLT